ncbi:MAG TPA: VOC family protein [Candidatus Rubrimentiphilum sp.]|nr:VOC family protein [Candidatus Rubrimentiphilum sp.]
MLNNFPMNGFVPTKDPAKARAFYEGVLGFELIGDNEYVATYRCGANKIMLQKGTTFELLQRTIVGWEVAGIREVVTELTARGVAFERFESEWMKQDDLGIWKSPEGSVAWFKDPDGNTLSVSEH